MHYAFENFVLDVKKHELRRGSDLVAVEPQVFALLIHLIEQRERVVSKEELIEAIWEGRFVSDSVVSSRIKSARKALGDDGRTQRYIKTLHGTGFRFIAMVKEDVESETPSAGPENVTEKTATAANDDAAAMDSTPAANASPTQNLTKPTMFGLAAAGVALIALFVWNMRTPAGDTDTQTSASVQSDDADAQAPSPEAANSASIAVLPFDDFSQAGNQEYFADGIAEELLNVLAQVEGLRVTSRTSAFAFKGRGASTGEIAEALGVSHVLEGSVRKSGETLRITAQLIDARIDQHVWSQTYDRALTAENLFAVQDEISQAIVAELQGRIVLPAANGALKTDSTEAYDAYLRGRALIASRTEDSIKEGIVELGRATALDPDFASVHSALVEAYVLAFSYAGFANEEAGTLAAPHAARALALAPDAPESLAAKGRALAIFDGNDLEAIDYFKRAIAANPNFADAHRFLGLAQSNLLHIDAAKASFEMARRLDPLAPVIYANLFRVYWDKDDLDAMQALGELNMRLNTESVFARRIMGGASRESGDYAAAHRLFKDNEGLYGGSRQQLSVLYHHIGRDDLAAPYAGAYLKAFAALRDGDTVRAAALIRGDYVLEEVAVLRWAGMRDAAYALIKDDIARRNLLSPEAQIAARDQTFDIYYTDILSENNNPAAATFRAKLSARFDDKAPADFRLRDSLYAGALWQMLNGNGPAALLWLDALIEAGHVWPEITFEPLFDPIRETGGFQIRAAGLEANAAGHRAAIEIQLADPGDGWVMP